MSPPDVVFLKGREEVLKHLMVSELWHVLYSDEVRGGFLHQTSEIHNQIPFVVTNEMAGPFGYMSKTAGMVHSLPRGSSLPLSRAHASHRLRAREHSLQ